MRKVILYIAASLDGFIAGEGESLSWLDAVEGLGDNGYGEFYETVDTILMGSRTYRWILDHGGFPYAGKECYIFSRTSQADPELVRFYSGDCAALVRELRGRPGRDIWLEGGGELARKFLEEGLVDEIILTVAPVLLGSGISLFAGLKTGAELRLTEMRQYGQFAQLRYEVRRT